MASPSGSLLLSAIEHEEYEGPWLFCPSALVTESPLPRGEHISKYLGMADLSSPSSPYKAEHVTQAWPFPFTVMSSGMGTQSGKAAHSRRPEVWTLEEREPSVLRDLEFYLMNIV